MKKYVMETPLLDFYNPSIQELVFDNHWNSCDENGKILGIYNYVRDSVAFGYSKTDTIPASQVLKDGYGQCNTKGILFMALLRAVGVPCRLHGFIVDKQLQKGAIPEIPYRLAPKEILHTWVEVFYKNTWLNLEGIILDVPYLTGLQDKFKECTGAFCGYGVATDNFRNPPVNWTQTDTYIQKEGIVRDLGLYDSPDQLFTQHKQGIGKCKDFLYRNIVRHMMNRKIHRIRGRSDKE